MHLINLLLYSIAFHVKAFHSDIAWKNEDLTDTMVKAAEKAADCAIGASGTMRTAPQSLHVRYYRKALFPKHTLLKRPRIHILLTSC